MHHYWLQNIPAVYMQLQVVGDVTQVLSQHPSERKVDLLPGKQLPVCVVYTPTSAAVSVNALDITDLLHSKKYRVKCTN